MSYEISGVRAELISGKPLPQEEVRSDRSRNSQAAIPTQIKPAESAQSAELDSRALEALAERAAEELKNAQSQSLYRPELEFKIDDISGRTVITVYHPETEEIIRQIPPEEALQLAQVLREVGSNGDLSQINLIRTEA